MILLLSPTKIQNFKPQHLIHEYTQPEFLNQAEEIVKEISQLSGYELSKLMSINASLGQLNANRYFQWNRPFTIQNAKQAVLAFNGEVFHGLDAKSLSPDNIIYLQSHLRILSGLYGVLRPLDLIQAYRLEISTKLPLKNAKDLYTFWSDRVTNSLNRAIENSGKPRIILNLASSEFFKTINLNLLKARVIHFEFLEIKDEKYKPIVVYIKKARGMMVRYITENRIENIEDLKGFSAEGYWFSERLSTENKLVFTRG